MLISQELRTRHFRILVQIQSTTVEGHSFLTDNKFDLQAFAEKHARTMEDNIKEFDGDVDRHMKEK